MENRAREWLERTASIHFNITPEQARAARDSLLREISNARSRHESALREDADRVRRAVHAVED